MGTLGLLPWIAHPVFWGTVFIGWSAGEISRAGVLVFVALWAAGFFVQRLLPVGFLLFPSYVAILDIVLVLLVFKGDVRLR
jgi:hypothetical protein